MFYTSRSRAVQTKLKSNENYHKVSRVDKPFSRFSSFSSSFIKFQSQLILPVKKKKKIPATYIRIFTDDSHLTLQKNIKEFRNIINASRDIIIDMHFTANKLVVRRA
ncbi:hypothetical protein PUN28_000093 [Cardiocondyla obscurior]|uniref:Uncharacterized protein n=1 Tax=Cardiocondyla obscurior TaxID=286306 RepID=A0AAW2GXQ5_9HYME